VFVRLRRIGLDRLDDTLRRIVDGALIVWTVRLDEFDAQSADGFTVEL